MNSLKLQPEYHVYISNQKGLLSSVVLFSYLAVCAVTDLSTQREERQAPKTHNHSSLTLSKYLLYYYIRYNAISEKHPQKPVILL